MLLLSFTAIAPVYPQIVSEPVSQPVNPDNGDVQQVIDSAAPTENVETGKQVQDMPLTEDQQSGNTAASLPQGAVSRQDETVTPPDKAAATEPDSEEPESIQQQDPALQSDSRGVSTEDQAPISDEAWEFLHQSGSLQETDRQPGVVSGDDVEAVKPDTGAARDDSELVALQILGDTVPPGEAKRLHWVASETFYGGMLDTPVNVIRGSRSGLTLCITAAVHGDELNGVEIVRRLINGISPEELTGTIIGVPIVNLLGFTRGSRYLPDRRDLNRYFPGNPRGSSASRIASSFMKEIVSYCDRLVDLHTGSLNRTNMPQLRANLDIPSVVEFTRRFGSTAVLHSRHIQGNLRTAATDMGIPAVTLELGEPGSLQEQHIDFGVKVMETLLDKLGMVKRRRNWSHPQPVYYNSRWVRVNNGGLLTTTVKVGAKVRHGNTLGIIVNPITSETYKIKSPYNGRVLGMSLNQFMLPGFAAFNIGIVTSETEAPLDAQTYECQGTGMNADQVSDEFDCSADGGDEAETPYDERDEMLEDVE